MLNHIPTEHEVKLTNALKERGVDFEIHHKDYYIGRDGKTKHKTVDILLKKEKIIIEVDGMQHAIRPETIISDFNRDYFSWKKGFFTKHITNEAINTHLNEIVNAIVRIEENAPNKMGDNLHK